MTNTEMVPKMTKKQQAAADKKAIAELQKAADAILARDAKPKVTTDVVVPVEAKPKAQPKVNYLKEGVTGKMMVAAKIKGNNAHKTEVRSLSFCLKQIKKHSKEFTKGIKNYKAEDMTPDNLLSHRTEKEVKRGTFTVWGVQQLVTRYYKAQ